MAHGGLAAGRLRPFEMRWQGAMFFPEPGKSLKETGRPSHCAAMLAVPLKKGSHSILLVQYVEETKKGSKPVRNLYLRQSDGTLKPVPAAWYRH